MQLNRRGTQEHSFHKGRCKCPIFYIYQRPSLNKHDGTVLKGRQYRVKLTVMLVPFTVPYLSSHEFMSENEGEILH